MTRTERQAQLLEAYRLRINDLQARNNALEAEIASRALQDAEAEMARPDIIDKLQERIGALEAENAALKAQIQPYAVY